MFTHTKSPVFIAYIWYLSCWFQGLAMLFVEHVPMYTAVTIFRVNRTGGQSGPISRSLCGGNDGAWCYPMKRGYVVMKKGWSRTGATELLRLHHLIHIWSYEVISHFERLPDDARTSILYNSMLSLPMLNKSQTTHWDQGRHSTEAALLHSHLPSLHNHGGAHGSVVGWGTMLQAGRSWVQGPMRPLEFFSFDLILPAGLWPWGSLGL
jgi:hypothetical protein